MAQEAGQPPCWAITTRAQRLLLDGTLGTKGGGGGGGNEDVAGQAGGSSGGKNGGGHERRKGQGEGGGAGAGGEGYQVMRDGFSTRGEDVHVLGVLQGASLLPHGPARGAAQGEQGGDAKAAGGGRGVVVEIGMPVRGMAPSNTLLFEMCYGLAGVCIDPLAAEGSGMRAGPPLCSVSRARQA